MRTPSRQRRAWALAAALFACGPAAAPAHAAVSDEQATQLEQQVRAWLADLLGPRAHLSDRPVQITAEDDHFRLEVPLDSMMDGGPASVTGGPITATATPLDGGRWAIDRIMFPIPLHVTQTMPGAGTSTLTFTAEEQTQSAVLDPSLATNSTWDSTIKGYAARSEGPQGSQTTRMEQIVNHLSLQPAEGGRVNMLHDFEGALLAVNSVAPQVGLVAVSAEHLHGSVHVQNVLLERFRPMIHALFELAPVVMAAAEAAADANAPAHKPQVPRPAPPGTAKPKPAMTAHHDPVKLTATARAALREALQASRDLSDGFDEQFTMENLHLEFGGHGGHAERIAGGFGLAAPEGKLTLRMNVALDGIDSPDIPPGVYRDYLPRHIAFAPRIGGLAGNDLIDLLILAVDSDGDDPALPAQAEGLLHKGPIAIGLDDLALDFGPVSLTGSGALQVNGRDDYSGDARFSATGIDELIRKASATPELAQGVPVLILLKGISEQDGDRMVWKISYRDGKMLVNGTDLSQMMPGK